MKMFDPIGAVNPGDIVWVPAVVVRIPDDPALLFVEVATRPIYPWDSWTQWATKARAVSQSSATIGPN